MNVYSQAASQIIKKQESIIGPIALDQANKIKGLEIVNGEIGKINGNGKTILNDLVNQYAKLFGQASIEFCKDAIREIKPSLPKEDLPPILQ